MMGRSIEDNEGGRNRIFGGEGQPLEVVEQLKRLVRVVNKSDGSWKELHANISKARKLW